VGLAVAVVVVLAGWSLWFGRQMLAPQKPSPLVLVVAQEHQDRQLAA
jgi:CTP:molybdopterin cytidylyltransferase MocA